MVKGSENPISSLNDSKAKTLLTIAIICAVAFLSTWSTGLIVEPVDNWPFRFRFLGVAFALGMGCTFLWTRHIAKQQRVAKRYFESLASVDLLKLAQGTLASDLPEIGCSNPWYGSAQHFTEVFRRHCERLEQAEHARTALGVRMKRNAARQAQFETILATIPEAVIAVDGGDQLILANPAAERLLGTDLLAHENRSITHVLHNEALVELLIDTRRRRAPVQRSIELELTATEGSTGWYHVTARTLASRDPRAGRCPADQWCICGAARYDCAEGQP